MSMTWVAFNAHGDLVAEAYSYAQVVQRAVDAGYDEAELVIGRWTP